MKDARWKGQRLLVYEDDASRFIVGHGMFGEATSNNAVMVLKDATARYGKPKSVLSDHGVQFYASQTSARERGLTEFEVYLMKNHIRHIVGRVNHPQQVGKPTKAIPA